MADAFRELAQQLHDAVGSLRREARVGRRWTAEPAAAAVRGDPDLARAVWAFAHGMTILELDGRFPPNADLDAAWASGIAALS